MQRSNTICTTSPIGPSLQSEWSMDLNKIIRELLEERKRITQIVESLEQFTVMGKPAPKASASSPRGRKSMGAEAREEVSRRMKKYWESRRKKVG